MEIDVFYIDIVTHVEYTLMKTKYLAPDTAKPVFIELFFRLPDTSSSKHLIPSVCAEEIGLLTFNDVNGLTGSNKSVADLTTHAQKESDL